MDAGTLTLARLRPALGRTWLIVLFGAIYLVSQATILVILDPLGPELAKLQLAGFDAETQRDTFRAWEATGAMTAYRAHFVLDDLHWLWYAGLFTTLLCRLFERNGVSHRWDAVLLLPLVSGLLDAYENALQHVFLSAPGPDYAAIVDPLPLLGTLASIGKWTLAAVYVGLAVALAVRSARQPAAGGAVAGAPVRRTG